jgi:hypothetical protein
VSENRGTGIEISSTMDKKIKYSGMKTVVKL